MQKMEIVRPPADVARYTMVFHKRDAGNEVNKDRWGALERRRAKESIRETVSPLFQDEAVGANVPSVEEGRPEQLLL